MINQILAMHKQGVSIRKISRGLGLSRNTVRNYLRDELKPKGSEIEESETPTSPKWDLNFPWETAIDLRKRGVTHKQIYAELSPAISYSRFSKVLGTKCKPLTRPTLRLDHEPCERIQIDFCDGPKVIDAYTGKTRKTYYSWPYFHSAATPMRNLLLIRNCQLSFLVIKGCGLISVESRLT